MKRAALLSALMLSACASPYEQCMIDAEAELAEVAALLEQRLANIARGYAVEEVETDYDFRYICGTLDNGRDKYCTEERSYTTEESRAVDIEQEKRMADQLVARGKMLSARLDADRAACRARFPGS
ncbi:hypothetical protein [Poseidonocella sedimentorum]|uniref:Excinuclease ABC subunit B n=1 Tax=Poseidonocella sedimentorum TaxID=871652 RepID=A0A1I6DUB3_9RHOB|nr:hypothetical protein [Poseidonocella sedimentorum]SFR09026.1 hypothetical protein SAMN04515673_105169 [Poseidonocella sedimentorum]